MTSSQKSQRLRQHMPSPLPHKTPSIDLEEISSQWPPIADFSNETPAQREERLEHEREAKRINDEIDAQIEIEKSERRRRRPDIRIILLGQSVCFHFPPPFHLLTLHNLPPPPSPFSFLGPLIQARLSRASQLSFATFSSSMRRALFTRRRRHGEPSSTSTSCVQSPFCSTSSRKVAPSLPALRI